MFSNNSYITIWKKNPKTTDDGRITSYSCQCSTSKKEFGGGYKTDFSSYVKFVGDAVPVVHGVPEGGRVKILNCGVSNFFNKQSNTTFWDCVVFSCEDAGGKPAVKPDVQTISAPKTDAAPAEDLPF